MRRFAVSRLLAAVALALTATAAAAALGASSAAAATGSVTITTGFENTPISLNTSDAVGYAITNTTGSTQVVSFTDTLPGGVTLDNPVAETVTGNCTLTSATANPGAGAVALTASVPSGTGTICTISFSIVANTPSSDVALADSYSGVSATSTTPTTNPGSLVVLSNPSLSFTAPANGQSFYLGQIADASFACTTTDPLDSINNFFGTDDEGNQIESGAPIDTVDPGTHTLEVDCYSAAGGGAISQTVSYQVGSYTLTAVRGVRKSDFVYFSTLVPAGKLIAKVIYGKKVLGTSTVTVTARNTVSVVIKPTVAGKRLLNALKGRWADVRLQVSFNPAAIGTGDQQIPPAGATVVARNLKIPLAHAARKPTKKKPVKKAKKAKRGHGARHHAKRGHGAQHQPRR